MILDRLLGRAPAPDEARWVVLDVESSGLVASRDRLLAIAAVAVHRSGRTLQLDLADSFEAVLRQADDVKTDKANILVHGIGIGEQRHGREPDAALREFAAWVGHSPMLGYHVAFDREMIERAHHQMLGERLRGRWLDIAQLAAVAYPDVRARALDDWLDHFGIECAVRHQAAADTLATAELLLRLWPRLLAEGVGDFATLERLAAQHRWVAPQYRA